MKYSKSNITLLLVFIFYSIGFSQSLLIESGQKLGETSCWSVTLQDLNGDKVLDVCIAGQFWINNGKGVFTKNNKSIGAGLTVSFGDLNGDGFIDAVSDSNIYLNDGHWSFIKQSRAISKSVIFTWLLDLDKDGDLDIIACTETSDLLMYNDGKGNFTHSGKSLGCWGQCKYQIGDVNGDGVTDIVVSIPHTAPPEMNDNINDKIWLGDGKRNFTENVLTSVNFQTRSAIPADVDGDGDLDLLMAKGYSIAGGNNWSKIYLNDGKGNFTDSGQRLNSGYNSPEANVADLNGDGYPDIFFANGMPEDKGQPNTVWLNNGKGVFSDSGLRLGSSNSIAVALGDIDGDGDIDALAANVDIKTNKAFTNVYLNTTKTPADVIDYFGQTPPQDTPIKFTALPSSSSLVMHSAPSFSPSGDQCFFAAIPDFNTYTQSIYYRKRENGKWSDPVKASFSNGKYSDKLPCFSGDGKRVYYTSDRPVNGIGNPIDENIWYIEKTSSGWNSPVCLDNSVNSSQGEGWITIAANNNLYFGRNDKLYLAKWENDHYLPAQVLTIFTAASGVLGTIAPDESYFIVQSEYVQNSSGSWVDDLYIIFQVNGVWGKPIKLDSKINLMKSKCFAKISPDGKYLFYLGNNNDAYWVSTDFIKTITGIGTDHNPEIPSTIRLNQNYPNPFNPTTVISYQLPVYSNVRLKIYDTLGREVKTLVDLFQNAGKHSIIWNAKDNCQNFVSSGIYFYSLATGNISIQRKMLLLR